MGAVAVRRGPFAGRPGNGRNGKRIDEWRDLVDIEHRLRQQRALLMHVLAKKISRCHLTALLKKEPSADRHRFFHLDETAENRRSNKAGMPEMNLACPFSCWVTVLFESQEPKPKA